MDESPHRWWPVELWLSFRPYGIALTNDFLVFVALWLGLRGAHALAATLPIPGAIAELLSTSFAVAVVASFVFVSSLALYDIREIHGRRR